MASIANQDHNVVNLTLTRTEGMDEETKRILRRCWVRNEMESVILRTELTDATDIHLIIMAREMKVGGKNHLIVVISSCSVDYSQGEITKITPTFKGYDCGVITPEDYSDDVPNN